jgi:hypothetical protein
MRKTADVTGGNLLQSISGVSAINPSVAFYDIHGGKKEVLFLYFCPGHHTSNISMKYQKNFTSLTISSVIEAHRSVHFNPIKQHIVQNFADFLP